MMALIGGRICALAGALISAGVPGWGGMVFSVGMLLIFITVSER